MTKALADELADLVDQAAAVLRTVDEVVASRKPRPDAWSIKEIVGHLTDSAANNHQRFVRAPQVAELSLAGYDQNAWVRLQDHQGRPWPEAYREFKAGGRLATVWAASPPAYDLVEGGAAPQGSSHPHIPTSSHVRIDLPWPPLSG